MFTLPKGHRFELGEAVPRASMHRRKERERFLEGPYGSNLTAPPEVPIFLYLTKAEWAKTWIDGGQAPAKLASSYLSDQRAGVNTPDEVGQMRWDGASEDLLSGLIKIDGFARNTQIIACTYNGEPIPDTRIDKFKEDAFLFCFSTKKGRSICAKLEKTICVEIINFDGLITAIRDQYGSNIRFGPIRYTESTERSHFMKHIDDSWMNEYRIVIPQQESTEISVELPAGIAKLTDISPRGIS